MWMTDISINIFLFCRNKSHTNSDMSNHTFSSSNNCIFSENFFYTQTVKCHFWFQKSGDRSKLKRRACMINNSVVNNLCIWLKTCSLYIFLEFYTSGEKLSSVLRGHWRNPCKKGTKVRFLMKNKISPILRVPDCIV